MPPACSRCGRALHGDREIGDLAEVALHELKNRRLVVPDTIPAALRTIADEMWCRFGVCTDNQSQR